MAKSLSVGPQTVSQSKFSSLKQKQKTHAHNSKFVHVKMRRKTSTTCVQKFVWLCITALNFNPQSPPPFKTMTPFQTGFFNLHVIMDKRNEAAGSGWWWVVCSLAITESSKVGLMARTSWKPSAVSELLSLSVCLTWLVCNDDLS